MFINTLSRLRSDLEEVKAVTQWQNDLRSAIYATAGSIPSLQLHADALATLRATAPNSVPWQLLDYCAAISRIYALFEQAVGDIVVEYLGLIPVVFNKYLDLGDTIRANHRTGVGQILQKWSAEKSLYSHLAEDSIAFGLSEGLRGKPYALLSDAFLVDSDNYRVDTINRVFRRIGLEDIFAGVRQCESIVTFCATNLSGTETADSFLNEFVRKRNDVAHGTTYTIVRASEINNYADFALIVVDALGSLLRSQLMKMGADQACAVVVGEVVKKYSNNIVGIEAKSQCEIAAGDILYGGRKSVHELSIKSIQVKATPHAKLDVTPGMKFGAMLTQELAVGSRIYRWTAR